MCRPVCVDVPSDTEAVMGASMKLTCIACLRREEIKSKTRVDWYYMPTKEKGVPPNRTHVGSSYVIQYEMVQADNFVNWHDNRAWSHLFSPPRFTSSRTTARPTWTALSKAASAGTAAKICKTSPSEFSMSRTMTAACTSATWSASLSLTTSSPQSPWPRTSGCLWRRKVQLTALHFVNCICLHCLFTASVKWILRWWKLPHLDDFKKKQVCRSRH